MSHIRPVRQIIEPQFVMEGAGVRLLRSITPHISNLFDPFLLFDHFAFNEPAEGALAGFPMHPYRGIETVTYMLAGSVHHRDSLGNSGVIEPEDVQWMTAGGGILHEEKPRLDESGRNKGFQLWVNLPTEQKMMHPQYQEVKAEIIPTVIREDCKIRVISGQVDGINGPVTGISAKPIYLDITVSPHAVFSLPVPKEHTCLAYFFEGGGMIMAEVIKSVKLVVFAEGEQVEVHASDEGTRFMLFAGAPFREPIVPYGPFVMNTKEEIEQALEDLRTGTFVKRIIQGSLKIYSQIVANNRIF
jgi:redox-sensitive bicupin YhaK (pirin superfamily)